MVMTFEDTRREGRRAQVLRQVLLPLPLHLYRRDYANVSFRGFLPSEYTPFGCGCGVRSRLPQGHMFPDDSRKRIPLLSGPS